MFIAFGNEHGKSVFGINCQHNAISLHKESAARYETPRFRPQWRPHWNQLSVISNSGLPLDRKQLGTIGCNKYKYTKYKYNKYKYSTEDFKEQLDAFLSTVPDEPSVPGFTPMDMTEDGKASNSLLYQRQERRRRPGA